MRVHRLLPFVTAAATIALGFGLAACQKKTENQVVNSAKAGPEKMAVDVVPANERSAHFNAVTRQLELGGTLYGYVDVDGDILRMMEGVTGLLGEISKSQPAVAPYAQKDYPAMAKALGLTDIKAIGASSVPEGDGLYRNRMFFYTGEGERHGLVAALGGKSGPFTHLKLAPADAGFYAEAEIDLPVAYRSIKEVIERIAGQPAGTQFEQAIKASGEKATLSVLDLIYGLKGHSSLVLRLDAKKPMSLPGPAPVRIPGLSLLLSIDGVAPIVEKSLAQTPLRKSEQGGLRVYEFPQKLPIEGFQPLLVADGNTLHLASSMAFFKECREQTAGLAGNADFQAALKAVGGEGNGLVYVHPGVLDALRQVESMNPNLPPQVKAMLGSIVGKLPKTDRPMITIRSNLPDGILVRSHWDRSLKQEVAMVSLYNPVTVGLLAAMAIPAFQKVRTSSQEKAVLNNLRMLGAAADQYYLENGVSTATYDQLVGPTRYVRVMNAVVGENYRTLRFVQGQPFRLQFPDGRVMTYPPGTVQPAPTAPKGR